MGNKASTGKKNDGHPHAQAFQRIYGGRYVPATVRRTQ